MDAIGDLLDVRASRIKGRGVFARGAIPRGALVLAIDDSEVVDPADPEQAKLIGAEPNHCDYLPDGTIVHMREPEACMNHSCDPNVFVIALERRRFVAAMRDSAPGEELVFDYSIVAFDGGWMDCRCGAAGCRGRHQMGFFAQPVDTRLRYLPYLDGMFVRIHGAHLLVLLENVVPKRPS
jgi:uncharacterized protein